MSCCETCDRPFYRCACNDATPEQIRDLLVEIRDLLQILATKNVSETILKGE